MPQKSSRARPLIGSLSTALRVPFPLVTTLPLAHGWEHASCEGEDSEAMGVSASVPFPCLLTRLFDVAQAGC